MKRLHKLFITVIATLGMLGGNDLWSSNAAAKRNTDSTC